MKLSQKNGKFIGTAKVGPKGQIVIPKEIRDIFKIEPGDSVIILADKDRGIAIERYETFSHIAEAIFDGKARELYPNQSEDSSKDFAKSIKKLSPDNDKK